MLHQLLACIAVSDVRLVLVIYRSIVIPVSQAVSGMDKPVLLSHAYQIATVAMEMSAFNVGQEIFDWLMELVVQPVSFQVNISQLILKAKAIV